MAPISLSPAALSSGDARPPRHGAAPRGAPRATRRRPAALPAGPSKLRRGAGCGTIWKRKKGEKDEKGNKKNLYIRSCKIQSSIQTLNLTNRIFPRPICSPNRDFVKFRPLPRRRVVRRPPPRWPGARGGLRSDGLHRRKRCKARLDRSTVELKSSDVWTQEIPFKCVLESPLEYSGRSDW